MEIKHKLDILNKKIRKNGKKNIAHSETKHKVRKFRNSFSTKLLNELEDELKEKLKKTDPISLIQKSKKFIFGNYDKYYNYRNNQRWQDPRIKVLEKEFFLNKSVLDIGCNDGSLTILLAIKFFPKKIIGIDIDYRLINKAISNFKHFEKQQNFCKSDTSTIFNKDKNNLEKIKGLVKKLEDFPKSFLINMGGPTSWVSESEEKSFSLINSEMVIEELKKDNDINEQSNKTIMNRFPENISFKIENFIKEEKNDEKFDTILCLSTSKWVHLNWGDFGMKRLFNKIYECLNDGGIFVFEPQEWRSYKKKKYFCEDFKRICSSIQLKPKNFNEYLIGIGFSLLKKVEPSIELNLGFKRTIYFYEKK